MSGYTSGSRFKSDAEIAADQRDQENSIKRLEIFAFNNLLMSAENASKWAQQNGSQPT